VPAGPRGGCTRRWPGGLTPGDATPPPDAPFRASATVAQFVVRDAAGFVARVDFAWPDARVIVEYEGRWHGESSQQVAKDRRRLNRLSAAGWTLARIAAALTR
jgi:hypothetical protein